MSTKNRRPVWTKESTYWLMEEMKLFEMREEKHQIKKRAVYEELAEKFTDANFTISWEAIQKKWQNLMSTYWRHLKHPKKEGQWEYFNEMDNILRNTSIWVGLNGCKDPSQATSLYYTDQQEDRFWTTERILFLLEEMKQLDKEEDPKGRRSVFHKIALSFHRLGVDIEWKAIQKKWHNLMFTFKRNIRKPREEVDWEYFDAMNSVMNTICTNYNRFGIPEPATASSSTNSTASVAAKASRAQAEEDESLWNEDNTLLLMEEMLAVKERKDKHLLKNRIVFREIADVFNSEGVQVDWKQVLKKWQSMFITYTKITRGIMHASLWKYFERMHNIVWDTDVFVGVGGIKKSDGDIKTKASTETLYQYVIPDETSPIVLYDNIQTADSLQDNSLSSDQFLVYHANTGTLRTLVETKDNSEVVTAEYVVSCSPSPKIDATDTVVVEFENDVHSVSDQVKLLAAPEMTAVSLSGNHEKYSIASEKTHTVASGIEEVIISGLHFDENILEKQTVFEEGIHSSSLSTHEGHLILPDQAVNIIDENGIKLECIDDVDKECTLVTSVTDTLESSVNDMIIEFNPSETSSVRSNECKVSNTLILVNSTNKKRKISS